MDISAILCNTSSKDKALKVGVLGDDVNINVVIKKSVIKLCIS